MRKAHLLLQNLQLSNEEYFAEDILSYFLARDKETQINRVFAVVVSYQLVYSFSFLADLDFESIEENNYITKRLLEMSSLENILVLID